MSILYYEPLFSIQEDPIDNKQPTHAIVGALKYWRTAVHAIQPVRETFHLFDIDNQIPGILVLENGSLIGLIPREQAYEKLGRPYGVELFFKLNNRQFYEALGLSTLVLPSTMAIDEAVNLALKRDESNLYDPIVIEYPDKFGVVSMSILLTAQQDILRHLYSEVNRISVMDPLTLINNRRGFFDAIDKILPTIRGSNLDYALLMVDIDKFKSINDRYGHLVGDEVIKSVSQMLASNLRNEDVIGRFGGEEFVVCLPGCTKESALNLAERLRELIASSYHIINQLQIRVTVSIGISHSQGARHTMDQLLSEADQAVYTAKNIGRNRVVIWEENMKVQIQRVMFRRNRRASTNAPNGLAEQIAQGFLHMLYLRDYETKDHALRVLEMALGLAERVGFPKEQLEGFRLGSLLHDTGKIGIPDKILFKPRALTLSEWKIMQKHPEYARDLLLSHPYLQNALDIPYCHHEHWDGSGYPRGLKGKDIPLAARIFTIVDVWDALTSDRPYRAAWKEEKVISYLEEQSSLLFDPELVPLFLEFLDGHR